MKYTVEIDLTELGMVCIPHKKEVDQNLAALYSMIWTEACYDPYNKQTQEYARRLLPHIERLNKILEFKK